MRAIVPAMALLLTAGCGFQPLYAPASSAESGASIGPVDIPEISGKTGHELKTALDAVFGLHRGTGAPRRLDIVLNESISNLGYRVNEAASRADLTVLANYQLFEPDGAPVVAGHTNVVVSYDIPNSAYGQLAAQNDARERAASLLAQRIRAELALKLAQKRQAAATSATQHP